MKATRRKKSERGSSLIEMAIASFVFTVGAMGLVALTYSSFAGMAVAEDVTIATALARSKLDFLTHLSFDSPALTIGTYTEGSYNIDAQGMEVTSSAFDAQDGLYARSWSVDPVDPPLADFKTITVTVRWWDKEKKLRRDVVIAGGKGNR